MRRGPIVYRDGCCTVAFAVLSLWCERYVTGTCTFMCVSYDLQIWVRYKRVHHPSPHSPRIARITAAKHSNTPYNRLTRQKTPSYPPR